MSRTPTTKGESRSGSRRSEPRRFSCIVARDSTATELLHGCPVVTAGGERIGKVKSILIDAKTRQLRYITLTGRSGSAAVVIPWHALYFDSALVRLVYYTYS
jgi:hypothetical protein